MLKKKMKAAVFYGARNIKIEMVPIPKPGPNDVLMKVKACGICGSDLHSYKLGLFIEPGQIMGHEYVGEIVEVGSEVKDVKIGERVTGQGTKPCRICYWCKRQEYGYCPDVFHTLVGYGRPGAFAEYVLLKDAVINQTIFKIPGTIDDETGATAEPFSVGVSAIRSTGIKHGDKVVVLGAGLIGNGCMQAAKAVGAQVLVTDISQQRLELAHKLGADDVFNVGTGNPVEWVKDKFGAGPYHFHEGENAGGMADVVIDAAGVPSTPQQAIDMVKSGGTICIVASAEEPAPIDTLSINLKGIRWVPGLGGEGGIGSAIPYLADGRMRSKELITHRFPLEEIEEAFETQLRPGDSMKVMITF
ncbi:zinc-binding dehydrogenase [Peribacillus frigoritolerans]|uniref:zinc-dependent alcohol dehydrogenase n=1 Tax=Peribacillus frigoritolerans TaxID=450367 RepID=UPI003871EB96